MALALVFAVDDERTRSHQGPQIQPVFSQCRVYDPLPPFEKLASYRLIFFHQQGW